MRKSKRPRTMRTTWLSIKEAFWKQVEWVGLGRVLRIYFGRSRSIFSKTTGRFGGFNLGHALFVILLIRQIYLGMDMFWVLVFGVWAFYLLTPFRRKLRSVTRSIRRKTRPRVLYYHAPPVRRRILRTRIARQRRTLSEQAADGIITILPVVVAQLRRVRRS